MRDQKTELEQEIKSLSSEVANAEKQLKETSLPAEKKKLIQLLLPKNKKNLYTLQCVYASMYR